MKNKYLTIILLSVIFSQSVVAQSFKFTTDTAFLNEMSTLVQKSKKEEVTLMYNNFSSVWSSGKLTQTQKASIILVSNNLLKKRALVYPHFYNYMNFIISILNSKNQSSQFDLWNRIFEHYSSDKSINSSRLNKMMEDFIFLNDSNALFESKAVVWKHNNDSYKLIFDVNEEPKIYFNKTDLICHSKRDSSVIYGTSGYYYPLQVLWSGQGGTVNWARTGYSKDSVFAKLSNYRIKLNLPEYTADTVEFTNKKYLKTTLIGHFEEKVLANARGENASYPRFVSYDKRVDLKQVAPGVDYSGGFAMKGGSFLGSGDEENKAELFIYKENDLFAQTAASSYTFNKENIQGNNVMIKIRLDEDTLWHPGLNFNYIIKNQKVALTRAGGGMYRSKFFDTYHKLDVDINEISFDLKDTIIYFKSPPATTYRKAIFESSNYFSASEYERIRIIDNVNPLEAVRNVAPTVGEEFEVKHLSHYLNKPESACTNLLMRLADEGFVRFDIETKIASPTQKLFDYIKSNFKKKDYDAIKIISEPAFGSNAILNLNNNELVIYGVKPFVLSENRRVGVIPENSTIRVKKDLEIDFDGKLQAGLARVYGEDMTFTYDSFFISLQKVDSLQLFYQSDVKNQDSIYEYAKVASTVDSITGLLRIDNPENKSGNETYPIYPIFESHQKSYVFYDQKGSKDTVYKKEEFFFENYPFEIDSLNTITKNNIRLKGIFNSGGVFPDFEEDLVVQPDSSLGFVHNLGEDGLPVYSGLGVYNNTITLNNSGLKGDGKITYLNTQLFSDQFDFYPDSMNTYANRLQMDKQKTDSLAAKYPEVHSDSSFVHWVPHRDQMFITSLDKPLNFFEEKAKFEGTIGLSPRELEGKGTLDFLDANLNSNTYTFYDESFTADTADFKLQPEPGSPSPFLTYNVNANVDFDKKLGVFKSNGDSSYIDFPVNMYKCYMNFFSWHMGINQIDIGTLQAIQTDSLSQVASLDSLNLMEENVDLYNVELTDTSYTEKELAERSKFLSTHPQQDSLSFYALSSSFDIKNFIIKAKGVKFITVADAHIFPASTIIIEPNAVIQPFDNARIVANRTTRYHTFLGAMVNVLGAYNYTASADYEYYDRLDSMQMIHFDVIKVDEKYKTVALGDIEEKSLFGLSPEFSYFGKIKIEAEQKYIYFDGYTKLNHVCENRLESYWLQFESLINPDSILIPLADQPKDNELRKLQTSMFVTSDSLGVYTSFLGTKRRFSDKTVLQAKGYLCYNDSTGYYEVADSAKLVNNELDGNYLSLSKKLCQVLGHGKMDNGVDLGQVKLTPVGKIRQNLDSWQSQMEVMLGVDFYLSDQALNSMAATLNSAYSLLPVDLSSDEYQLALRELVGKKRATNYVSDFALYGGYNSLPQEMNKSLFLSQVKLKWNNYHTAWESDGKIGIGNIKNNQVSKFVDGFVEIRKSRGGDMLNIYLEIDPKTWFFFTYTRGTLKTISSNDDYNNYIINLKDKDRKSPVKDEDNPYMFFPATDRAKDNFVTEMKNRLKEASEEKNINLDNKFGTNKKRQEEAEQEVEEEDDLYNEEGNEEEVIIEAEEIKDEGEESKDENEIKSDNKDQPVVNENDNNDQNKEKQDTEPVINENKQNEKEQVKDEKKKEPEIKKEDKVKQEEEIQEEEIQYEEEEEEEDNG